MGLSWRLNIQAYTRLTVYGALLSRRICSESSFKFLLCSNFSKKITSLFPQSYFFQWVRILWGCLTCLQCDVYRNPRRFRDQPIRQKLATLSTNRIVTFPAIGNDLSRHPIHVLPWGSRVRSFMVLPARQSKLGFSLLSILFVFYFLRQTIERETIKPIAGWQRILYGRKWQILKTAERFHSYHRIEG